MDDLVSKFINFFFPPSKTTNLRNEITNFRQIAQESFSEAWERFKELLRKCPHHGFSLMHQLDTFYNSLSYNDQDSLNSAAGGNFLYKSHEGYKYRGNLRAKVRCSRNAVMRVSTNAPPPSSNSSSNFEFQQMAAALEDKMTLTFRNEMNEMKNMMKALVPTPVPINAGWRRCTTCGSNHSFNVCPRLERVRVPVYHDNFHNVKQTLRLVILLTWKMRIPSSQISEPYSPLVFLQTKVNHPIKGISLIKEWYLTKRSTTKFSIVLANQLDNFQENTEGSMQITNGFPKQFAKAFCWWFLSKSKPTFYFYFYGTYTLPSNTITNPRKNDGTKDKVLPSTKTSTSGYPKILCPVKSVSSPNSPEPSSAQVDNSPPSKEPSKKNRLPYPSRVEHEKKGFPDFGSFMVQNLWKDKAMPTISIDGLQYSLHKAIEIASLKKRVDKLEKRRQLRTTGLTRFKKFGVQQMRCERYPRLSRSIDDIAEYKDLMFDTGVLDDDEVFVDVASNEKNEQSTKIDDSTTGEVVTTASVEDSDAPTFNVIYLLFRRSYYNTQAMMEADRLLAERLQSKEREELTDEEKGKLFMELMEKRRKHFAALKAQEKRNIPLTKAQKRTQMSTYLKKQRNRGQKGSEETTKASRKKMLEEKKAGNSEQQGILKKQKIEEDNRVDEVEEVSMLVHYQLIRADGSSKRYTSMIRMLQGIDREYLEVLWRMVKANHNDTRPEDEFERVLWGDLKVMFEPDITRDVCRMLQGYRVAIWKLID
ncbi:reverse transcriptase domain-containing protein [Tanacetum coccineum]